MRALFSACGLVVACGLAVALGGCKKGDEDKKKAKPPAHPTAKAIDLHDPATCQGCHPAILAEYQQSMHARAHHQSDPIYRGVRGVRMKKEGAAIAKACERCHQPDAAKAPAGAGVTCFACHGLLAKAPAGALIGPHDLKANPAATHGLGPASPLFKDGRALCMTCHDSMTSPKGVAMCTTGPEHAKVTSADETKSCVGCHMPRTRGPGTVHGARKDHASHAFLGPHRAWYQKDPAFVASGVKLSARLAPGALTIELANQSGHGFPTGFPGRVAFIECRGLDAKGAEAWSCKPVRLGKVYHDANGKPTLAPFATKLAVDSRIEPGATKKIDLAPPKSVAKVEVQLTMRLLPKKLAKKLGLTGKLEDEPRVIAKAVAEGK
jgi:hypothetical protein